MKTATQYRHFRGSRGWYVARGATAGIDGHMTESVAKKAAVESNRFNPSMLATRPLPASEQDALEFIGAGIEPVGAMMGRHGKIIQGLIDDGRVIIEILSDPRRAVLRRAK